MRRLVLWVVMALAFVPALAMGQAKPIGAYSPDGAPGWVSFGVIGDTASDAMLDRARERCVSGFKWIVAIGFEAPPLQPANEVAAAARTRFERAGVWPCVVAITYGEEWYEHFFAGSFASLLPPTHPEGVRIVHHWMGLQHARAREATGKPVIWVTTAVHVTRPVPANTDYVALDPYPPDGARFADVSEPILLHAEVATHLPLVLIPRWFSTSGPYQGTEWRAFSGAPTQEMVDGYARIFARPRWVAMLGFLWESRPYADLVGLADMPHVRDMVERALRLR